MGVDSSWKWGYGFGLFANAAGSFYWSRTKITQSVEAIEPGSMPERTRSSSKSAKYHRIRPMAQAALGIDGSWCFAKRYAAKISAAYEFLYWWQAYEAFFDNPALTTKSDLSFQGYTVSAGVDF